MITEVTVIIIIILLLLIRKVNDNNNNGNVSWIWFQNEGPIEDKTFWPVFVLQRGCLSFEKLFLKTILPSGANSKTSFK